MRVLGCRISNASCRRVPASQEDCQEHPALTYAGLLVAATQQDQVTHMNEHKVVTVLTEDQNALRQDDTAEHEGLAAILVRLLEDADKAINRNRDAARACIARASALLRVQRRRVGGYEHASVTLVRGGLAPWQMARANAYIKAHLDSTFRMPELATTTGLSTGHFSRSFKRSFGVTPAAYIAGRRVARAQDLMLTTDEPLCQIALACGICDQSHLTRMFRRHVGTSPNVWRRRHRGERSTSSSSAMSIGMEV